MCLLARDYLVLRLGLRLGLGLVELGGWGLDFNWLIWDFRLVFWDLRVVILLDSYFSWIYMN